MPPVSKIPEKDAVKILRNLDEYHTTTNGKKFILYHTNWATYGRNFQVKDLPIDIIPEIAYAFFNVDQYGNITSGDTWADFDKRFNTIDQGVQPLDNWNDNTSFYGNLGQFRKLKEQGKKFNLAMSIGGWSWSKYFSSAVSSFNRTNFVNSIINMLQKYPIFCSISIDWEFFSSDGVNHGNSGNESRREDPDNLIETLKLLRFRLNTIGKSHYKISVCCSANPSLIQTAKLLQVSQVIDELHCMTYDFSDFLFSKPIATSHTNLKKSSYSNFSVEESVEALLKAGIQSTKIFIGSAFYSRGFITDGPGKQATGKSVDTSWETGIVDYKALPLPGSIEYWDPSEMSPFSYDKTKKIYNSYDNINSIYYKSRYVLEKNLGGIIVWESSGDHSVSNPRCLTQALNKYLIQEERSEPPLPQIWESSVPPETSPVPPETSPVPPETSPGRPQVTPFWQELKDYKISDKVIYEGIYYVCIIQHTSQKTWNPIATKNVVWREKGHVVQPVPPGIPLPPVTIPVIEPVKPTPPVKIPEIPVIEPVKPMPPVTSPDIPPMSCNCEKIVEKALNKHLKDIKSLKFNVTFDIVEDILDTYK